MDLAEMTLYCLDYLQHHKTRSILTVLGIVVGIASVILLVGLVQGLKEDVLEQLEDFGPRTMVITPARSGGAATPGASFMPTRGKLFDKDFERVSQMPEVRSITKIIMGQTTVSFKDESIGSSIYGIEADVFDDSVPVEIESGRFIESSDRGVAGIGADIAESFDEDVRTQSNLYLSGERFKVIGVLKPTGNSFAPIDTVIFISIDDARDLFNDSLLDGEISAIYLTMKEGTDIIAAEEEVNDIMLSSHRVTEDDKDFSIISPRFINDRMTGVLDLLTLFLGAIASISLIVGGIGISNTMFMSVLERRREIGTMKALGATTEQIRNLFVVESAMIGLAGGLIGLATAVGLGFLITLFDITFVYDPFVIAGSIAFSISLGLISGTLPAIDAAKIDPIEALRYE
ncbi:MAG: ABC transporter permease [Candidatus Micrarchaeota archaeon]